MARIPTIVGGRERPGAIGKVSPGPKVDKRHRGGSLDWAESGRWVNVKSSNVSAIKYDRQRKHLYVRFHGNSEYRYRGVARNTAESMFTAVSMGKFVWHVLRKRGLVYEKLK